MPWHDVAIQIRGSSVHDVARHFTNYWNFVNFQTKIDNDTVVSSSTNKTFFTESITIFLESSTVIFAEPSAYFFTLLPEINLSFLI